MPDWYGPFRNHNRVLLVFAPSGADRDLEAQRTAFGPDARGFAERELVVIEIVRDRADDRRVDARSLRDEYRAPVGEFAVVLIGKDGGEKLRRRHPISEATLFGTIDAMPMRRGEMSRQTKAE